MENIYFILNETFTKDNNTVIDNESSYISTVLYESLEQVLELIEKIKKKDRKYTIIIVFNSEKDMKRIIKRLEKYNNKKGE